MSGIGAVWRKANAQGSAKALSLMAAGMQLGSDERAQLEPDGDAGACAVRRFDTQQVYRGAHTIVACDASLTNAKELATLIGVPADAAADANLAFLLARLYERYGETFLERLEGGFSLVAWDRRARRLIAAIDPFGIKRLVYYQRPTLVLVSTRVDALVRAGELEAAINPRAIPNLLNFSANLAPDTIYQGVERLTPGTVLIADENGVRTRRYWDIRYESAAANSDPGRLIQAVRRSVAGAVRACCDEAPAATTGAFLSGGTDSSTVVGIMSGLNQFLPPGAEGRGPVNAFSIGFEDQSFNELSYARLAASHFNAIHHTYIVGPDDCFSALPAIIRQFDEPFGNASAIPTYFCGRLAAQNGFTALIAGDGGDEIFAGNERYAIDKIFHIYHSVPRVLRKGLIEPALGLPLPAALARRGRNYVRRAYMPGPERMLSFQFLYTHEPATVFDPAFLEALDGYTVADVPVRHYAAAGAGDHLNRLLYLDMKITLADNDLPKVTTMAELAGIQAYFPYLAKQVVECCAGIPVKYKLRRFEKRYLFKRAFGDLLPPEILRKKKHGFGVPVSRWLKTHPPLRELARDTLSSTRCLTRGYFRRDFLDRIFRDHESDTSSYYGDTLWTLLALELWHVQAADRHLTVYA